MSKVNFSSQAEKLKSLRNSASLQTSSVTSTLEKTEQPSAKEAPLRTKTRAKNLRAVPLSFFEAHDQLKSQNGTSLDFSAYILEATREKLERDGALKG